MSHLDVFKTEPGKPFITNLTALERAANILGLRMVKKSTYRWFGTSVGDYPIPAGMTKQDLGKNAAYVLELPTENCAQLGINPHGLYDLAVVEDPNNEGAYTLVYDFYGQQNRLDKVIGSPVRENGIVTAIAPTLVQRYRMVCVEMQAQQLGCQLFWDTAENGDPIARVVPPKKQESFAFA